MLIQTGYPNLLHGFNLMNYEWVWEEGFSQIGQFRYIEIGLFLFQVFCRKHATNARDFHSPSRALSAGRARECKQQKCCLWLFLPVSYVVKHLSPRHSKKQNIRFSFTFIELFWWLHVGEWWRTRRRRHRHAVTCNKDKKKFFNATQSSRNWSISVVKKANTLQTFWQTPQNTLVMNARINFVNQCLTNLQNPFWVPTATGLKQKNRLKTVLEVSIHWCDQVIVDYQQTQSNIN